MKRKTNRQKLIHHRSLDQLVVDAPPADGLTRVGGRLAQRAGRWFLQNATASLALNIPAELAARGPDAGWVDGALVQVTGRLGAAPDASGAQKVAFAVDHWHHVHTPRTAEPALTAGLRRPLGDCIRARDAANRRIRAFFEARDFLEVETPNWVEAAGTDVHLAPVEARFEDAHRPGEPTISGQLHTSPEFSMKRLLAAGMERIWQMGKVWRNGEITPLHNPEFTLLEWYRAWEALDAIIADVEALSRALLGDVAQIGPRKIPLDAPFLRMTMQQVVEAACGFDLLSALEFDALLAACADGRLLSERSLERARQHRRWDELFFELQISYIDPFLLERGPVFVTEWPTPLAVLARTKPEDPRVAQRFELYIGGVELANGFQELTDPDEQRRRFEEDLATRRRAGLPEPPMPERFLQALQWGLPPSSGVAVGVDRYLMLQTGAEDIREVAPFAMRRDPTTGQLRWA